MTTFHPVKATLILLLTLLVSTNAQAAATTLADAPLVTSASTTVLPNVMFVLDDSGSMDWDYMPDNAKNFAGKYGFNSSQCNGTYYDPSPSVTYDPPVDSTGAPLNATPTTFSAAYKDGFVTGAGTVDLSTGFTGGSGSGASGNKLTAGPAYYYVYTGTQTDPDREKDARLKNYFSTTSTFYKECVSAIGVAPGNAVFKKIRLALTPVTTISVASGGSGSPATITLSGSNTTKVTNITVNGAQILSASTSKTTSKSTIASDIANGINACTIAATGTCTVSGYSATVSGNSVILSGPAVAAGYSPVISCSFCGMTFSTTAFPTVVSTSVSSITVNGVQLLPVATAATTSTSTLATSIASGITAAGYSATATGSVVTLTGPTSASNYTPVIITNPVSGGMVLTTDSFPESTPSKLQKFANWYSYYSNRMLMMKTGAGLAFKPVSDKYRVGFLTMNNNVSPGITVVAPFDAAQRVLWYDKLYASNPGNSTPLREALSHVGQYYAHKFGSVTTYKATLTIGGSGSTEIAGMTVNGFEIMLDSSKSQTSTSAMAAAIAAQINLLDGAVVGGITQASDYGASVSGSTVTITGPASSAGFSLVIDKTGSMTTTATAFTATTTTAQLNGITPADPMEYSCQKNFTILSTDGYWNGSTTYDLVNATVGQQDGSEPRPYNDGGSVQKTTSQLQATVTQLMKSTSQQQSRTLQIQSMYSYLQKSTASLQSQKWQLQKRTKSGGSWGSWSNNNSCTYGSTVQCRYVTGSLSTVSSCTDIPKTTSTTSGTVWDPAAQTCSYGSYSAPSNVASCTYVAKSPSSPYTVGTAVNCTYTAPAWVNTSSCTLLAPSPSSPYTVGIATSNCQTTDTGWVGAGSCTAAVTGGTTVTCQTNTTGPTAVLSCTAATANSGNNYTQTTCATNTISVSTGVATCSAGTGASPNYYTTACNTITVGPTAVTSCTPATASASNAYTTTTCSAGSGGTSNTLADVAEYYYVTDLRTTLLGNCTGALGGVSSVCTNNVKPGATDTNPQQHMTTFTLGLGTRGRMVYSPTYLTDIVGDYNSVYKGLPADSSAIPPVCSWQANGTVCNWPTPASGAVENIDDLWHAAVNGRGNYFSATDPTTLASSISGALAKVDTTVGSSSAATTSNPNVTAGDNFVFSSTFTTVNWDGELVRQLLDPQLGTISSVIDWAAQGQLDTKAALTAKAASRTIYTYSISNLTTHLQAFNETNFGASTYFNMPNISTSPDGLTQFLCASGATCLSTTDQVLASGNALVNFLRGDRTNEGLETDNSKYFRQRTHVLGDIVNAEAVYVKASLFKYLAAGYSDFVTNNNSRLGVVYAASNDGMLHAFKGGGATVTSGDGSGDELWAYIPSKMLPNLYRLADKKYYMPNYHKYFVDGTPVVGDICPTAPSTDCTGSTWKTILVGGFNKGGNGFYALDITNPNSPKALWEFTDANMGYSYGNPVITRLADGTWVVMVTSGYNNVPAPAGTGGDGIGRLYVLNAATGALVTSINGGTTPGIISTGAGDTTTPSGLSRIAVFVDDAATSNTALAVYGGDQLGNLWRFDVNNDVGAAGNDAQLLATLKGPGGLAQPITTQPALGEVNGIRVVFVGTGQYLGTPDSPVVDTQSIYGIKDPLATGTVPGTAIYANPRSLVPPSTTGYEAFINQSPITVKCPPNTPTSVCSPLQDVRTSPNNAMNFATDGGWYLDMPDAGERDNTDPTLSLGTLGFTTNVPNNDACTVGGYSYRYFLDYRTGGSIGSANGVISTLLGNALATRPVYVRLENGNVIELTRLSTGETKTSPVPVGPGVGTTRRSSWRELISE